MGKIMKHSKSNVVESAIGSSGPFELEFGSTAKPLVEQLKNKGVQFDERSEFISQFQRDADGITYLMARGLLTFDQRDQARKKLMDKIREYLEKG